MTISTDMIQSLMLRQGKGRYDPKDLEGVLPVLYRRLYDRGDGGVVLSAGLGPEASAWIIDSRHSLSSSPWIRIIVPVGVRNSTLIIFGACVFFFENPLPVTPSSDSLAL